MLKNMTESYVLVRTFGLFIYLSFRAFIDEMVLTQGLVLTLFQMAGWEGCHFLAFCMWYLFQSVIKRRFSFNTFCACANFININISANALWQSPLKSYGFK